MRMMLKMSELLPIINSASYKCAWCQFRHDCSFPEVISNCREFKLGGCYTCKYHYSQNGRRRELCEQQALQRGCAALSPSSLYGKRRKRLGRKRKKRLKSMNLW